MLRSEIISPVHTHVVRLVFGALALGALGVGLYSLATCEDAAVPPQPIVEETGALLPVPTAITASEPAAPVRSNAIQLVFQTGGVTYMQLASVDPEDPHAEPMPKHGALTLFDRGEPDDYITSSVGTVKTQDVPLAYRDWLGRQVVVDGHCTAKVTGFAVVARLTGDPGYADGETGDWSTTNVVEHGHPILAARLDGCKGTFARDAALPAIVIPTRIDAPTLAAAARAQLLASEPARAAQRTWLDAQRTGDWQTSDSTTFDTIVVKHPTTGVTWVSVHARVDEGCGGPEINVWGLYRAAGTKLVAVQQRSLGDLFSVNQLIDVDNDGELEFIGHPWIATDTVVSSASGAELARLVLPFYGCPC